MNIKELLEKLKKGKLTEKEIDDLSEYLAEKTCNNIDLIFKTSMIMFDINRIQTNIKQLEIKRNKKFEDLLNLIKDKEND